MTNKANEQVTMAQINVKNDMVKENMTKEKMMKNVNERKAVWSKMFPNIAGYDKIREEGAQIVDMIENKEEYLKVGARCPRGWFFYGEPGMGKTQLVLDIASYVHYPIIEISYSDAINKKLEINEDIVSGFAEATKLGKGIIFIDEMDKFAGYKKYAYEVPENLKTQKILLHELDKIKNKDDIIVIATANKRDYLDEAMLRSGRFDRQIFFDKPNAADREAIIKHFLKEDDLSDEVDIFQLVKITGGRSCADIECMVNEAKIAKVGKRASKIGLSDFTAALNRIIFSDIPKDASDNQETIKTVAYHEAGHAFIGYLLQPDTLQYASIIPQGVSNGKVRLNVDENLVQNKKLSENSVKIGLAGMVAVYVMTGEMAAGNKSDLTKALTVLTEMLNEGFYGLRYVAFAVNKDVYGDGRYSSELTEMRTQKIMEIAESFREEVEEILKNNKPALEALACALVDKRELSASEIGKIIEEAQKA